MLVIILRKFDLLKNLLKRDFHIKTKEQIERLVNIYHDFREET